MLPRTNSGKLLENKKYKAKKLKAFLNELHSLIHV